MLGIDLKGKKALIVGIGDDQGFGWAIAKALAEAGAEILIGTWAPIVRIFTTSWNNGKFDESRKLSNGQLMTYSKLYPIDAVFDKMEDVPQEIKENKRYAELSGYTVSDVAEAIKADFGQIDILVHSLANAPEVTKNLLDTSRKGYLAAMSSSAYSFISLLAHFGPLMTPGGSALSLTYIASERVIPGYGGVDGHDRWLEHMDRLHCRSDSVGNIVELEIEEDRQAQFMDLMYPMVAMGAEEFEPQLEAADMILDLAGKRFGRIKAVDIESKVNGVRHVRDCNK